MADYITCDKLHTAGNMLTDTPEVYYGRDNDVRYFDASSAHTRQRDQEDAGVASKIVWLPNVGLRKMTR